MKCPFCGHLGDKVVDSRESKEGNSIRRRRECLGCGKRYTSREHIEEIEYRVIKKDGRPEPFSRQKLVGGLMRACEKRPVSVQQLEGIADRIESELGIAAPEVQWTMNCCRAEIGLRFAMHRKRAIAIGEALGI